MSVEIHATQTLTLGDWTPRFGLCDRYGEVQVLRNFSGEPVVLLFYASDRLATCQATLQQFCDRQADFAQLGVKVLCVSLDPPDIRQAFARDREICFYLLSDPKGTISREYGVCGNNPTGEGIAFHRTAFLLDRWQRIARIYSASAGNPVPAILADIATLFPPQEPRCVTMQAPVLLVPHVLPLDLCRHLIRVWETEGHAESGFMRAEGTKTVGYIDHTHKRRTDHFMQPGPLRSRIDALLQRRLFPEIQRAFNYEVTRREDYKIARYAAETGGYFRPHRDNTTGGTAHRRFAMTINLNAEEYEGGYLRFPEYGNLLYKPETGGAVIFSCSLLHEATDVTAGHRFALLTFLYGEAEAAQRQAYERQAQNNYEEVRVLSPSQPL